MSEERRAGQAALERRVAHIEEQLTERARVESAILTRLDGVEQHISALLRNDGANQRVLTHMQTKLDEVCGFLEDLRAGFGLMARRVNGGSSGK